MRSNITKVVGMRTSIIYLHCVIMMTMVDDDDDDEEGAVEDDGR